MGVASTSGYSRGAPSWPEALPKISPRRSGISHSTQIYLVCSARARLGKTTLARLIVEYCRADAQPEMAYTIDPIESSINDFLPGGARTISIAETPGQMALFDRLVIDDATTKIVDIGHQALDRFFTIAYDIELGREARRHGIDVVVTYLADPSDLSRRTYEALRARFPEFSFVPVFNDAVARGLPFRNMFLASSGGVHAINLPQMSPVVHAMASRAPFSFNDFLRRPPAIAPRSVIDEIDGFRKRAFRQLRETELSLLLNRLRLSLSEGAA